MRSQKGASKTRGVCNRCGSPRPLHTRCKTCRNEYLRARYADNPSRQKIASARYIERFPEKNKARHQRYAQTDHAKQYRSTHQKQTNARVKAWVQEHPDRAKAMSKRYYESHKNDKSAYSKRWKAANPEKALAYDIKSKARKAQSVGEISGREWLAIMRKYKWRCVDCGHKHGDDGKKLSLDHIIPRGGKDVTGSSYAFNLVPRCMPCNHRKYNHIAPGTQHTLFDRFK